MKYVISTLLAIVILTGLFLTVTPSGRAMVNNYRYGMQKVDDQTLYETRKKVEDEARAMVSSYEADKLRYEQYKLSTDKQQLEWGEQAKMRANQTASVFNNFILKNSYVFQGNVPQDINFQLQLVQ